MMLADHNWPSTGLTPWYLVIALIVLVPLVLTATLPAARALLVLAVGLIGAAGLFVVGLALRDESAREPLTNSAMLALVAFLFAFWAAGTGLGYLVRRYRGGGGFFPA